MKKKVIAFDLDDTLAESKSPITDRIDELLTGLLEKVEVCIISGGKFEQFEKQLFANLHADTNQLRRLHIIPVCGTQYFTYNTKKLEWKKHYSEDLTKAQKAKIIKALNKGFTDLGYRESKTYGECIEDRGSQVTFSVLGQDIVDVLGRKGVELKKAWDPGGKKRLELKNYISKLIPEFEVRGGGSTSIDVTKIGVDKAYGMKKLMKMLNVKKEEILFIGDRLQEGGNDYPVKAMGIDSIGISHWQETALVMQVLTYVLV